MWLRDFLPADLRDADVRILTFGYNSGLKDGASTSSLHDFSRLLLDGVNSARSDAGKARMRKCCDERELTEAIGKETSNCFCRP